MEKRVQELTARHLAGEPVAYLIGEWSFYGLDLDINESVLIPRIDTEVLAEKTIEFVSKRENARVLDLCAGSGCVAPDIHLNLSILPKSDLYLLLGHMKDLTNYVPFLDQVPILYSNLI